MKNLKLNKKGFTLIELLAVIVVLAIIIVIAVPSVLNIQNNAKRGAAKDEALLLVKSIELCISDNANKTLSTACAPSALTNYYDDAANNVSAATGVTTTTDAFYYAISDAGALTNFTFSSNGYKITVASASSPTDLKNIIDKETSGSISITK